MTCGKRRGGPAAVAGPVVGLGVWAAMLAGCAGPSPYASTQAPGLIDCGSHLGSVASCTDLARMAFLPGR